MGLLSRRAFLGVVAASVGCRVWRRMSVQVVCAGDSLTAGNHLSSPSSESYPALVGVALPSLTVTYIGVGSTTISDGSAATADALYSGSYSTNILTVAFGNNDSATQTPAEYVATEKAYCLARRGVGFKVIVLTNIGATATGFNAWRNTANALRRADSSYYDALADVASNLTIGTDAAPSNGSLFSDGIHPTALGETYVAPYVVDAINVLTVARSVGWRAV